MNPDKSYMTVDQDLEHIIHINLESLNHRPYQDTQNLIRPKLSTKKE
jgi:hypothetical protein